MYFELENLKMNVEIVGEGQPVLIIHGFSGHLNTMKIVFEPIFAEQKAYQRIYIDLPGMGDSNGPLTFASSDRILAAVLTFIEKTIDQPFLLIGYSYGGYLARAITVKRPDWVRGLMLLAPMVVPDHTVRRIPNNDWFKKFNKISTKKYLSAGWKKADRTFLKNLSDHYAVSFDLDAQAHQSQFDQPSLLVLGRQDTIVGYADQVKVLEDYPRATFSILDMAGHNLQLEQTEVLKTLLINWLGRCENEI